jgi:hybrid polyketide synthase/nonribosomal peptide synthetase ACE1
VTARESSIRPARTCSVDEDQTIVLTGATGFLGQVLLQQLLENDKVSKVHCIGVRSPARLQSFQSPKLAIHGGDLASPRCGLSQEASDNIFSTAHAVIHNGADVHFLKSYQVLRPVNVDSTKWLAAQALSNSIPFHYVSTASVIQYARPSDPFPPSSVNAFPPPTDGRDGYAASKWASEQYLEQLSTEFGLDVYIHRPTAITGPNTPAQDIFPNVMRFSREIKAVPVFDFVVGYLDFIDVHSVAKRILQTVAAAAAPRSSETKGPRFYHHSGEVVIPTSGLREYLQRELNDEVVEVRVREWVEKATQAGMDSMVGEYMKSLEGLKEPIFLPQVLPS